MSCFKLSHLFVDLNIHLVHFGSVLFWVHFLLKWDHGHLPELYSSFSELLLSHFYANCDLFCPCFGCVLTCWPQLVQELRKAIFSGVENESISIFKDVSEFSDKAKNFWRAWTFVHSIMWAGLRSKGLGFYSCSLFIGHCYWITIECLISQYNC